VKPPVTRTNNRWAYAAPSGIHGRGLFARADIPAGTDIVEYDGPRVPASEGKSLAEGGNVFVFRLNRREAIDGSVAWNLGRHANHSCAPNAESVNAGGRIWLRALRAIKKGEEVTYDYGYSFRDEPVPCSCGAPDCAGVIVAGRHRGSPTRFPSRPRS
jgi:SET domain-containing protein